MPSSPRETSDAALAQVRNRHADVAQPAMTRTHVNKHIPGGYPCTRPSSAPSLDAPRVPPSAPMATANGNALFAEGRLTEAGKAYTSALESSPPPSAAQRSVLLSNRAACHYGELHAQQTCLKAVLAASRSLLARRPARAVSP